MTLNTVYNVAVCEDEEVFSEELEKICRDIFNRLSTDYHINVFGGSADFLKAFGEGKRYNLILLDILMDGMDGIQLARQVRETDKDATIIFITSSRDYALQGYDVNALHYLMKPVDGGALEKLIANDYNKRIKNDYFVFESGAGKYRAAIRDIICFETVGRQVEVILKEGTIPYAGKLSELLLMMPKDRIIRCHQSFAVNIANIRELNRYTAIDIQGNKIPISRTFSKEVQKAFLRQLWEV